MEKITIIITIATLLNAITTIINFVKNSKKGADAIIKNSLNEALQPVEQSIKKLDINRCKDFLVDFLTDVENGVKKDDIQITRAYEVYDHYTMDLHGNSYIHDKWTKLMK